VGADLVGKIEQDIPEDDPRNPAVIADLVGDNVGDCAARGADLFESIAAEIISAMILGATMAKKARMSDTEMTGFMMFPLVVHCIDLVVSAVGIMSVAREAPQGRGPEDPLQVRRPINHLYTTIYMSLLPLYIRPFYHYIFLCAAAAKTGLEPRRSLLLSLRAKTEDARYSLRAKLLASPLPCTSGPASTSALPLCVIVGEVCR